MKIIFDSKEERDSTIQTYCPSMIGLKDADILCDHDVITCVDCWKIAVRLEIKSDKEESIKMTAENKQPTYTDCVYELIKDECNGMDSIYEDYIVSLVGNCGLAALKRAGLVESCGVLNCRQLYTLVNKVVLPKDYIKIDVD